MLIIEVPLKEDVNEKREFVVVQSVKLEMEHSLATLSKWESFFEKSFLATEEKTAEETMWYIGAMTLTPNVPPEVFAKLSEQNVEDITQYIKAPMTATTFHDPENTKPNREIITAEIIYHWMLHYNIWLECEHWHLNRLLALIRTCSAKNAQPKKMSRRDMISQRDALNAKRKAELGIRG